MAFSIVRIINLTTSSMQVLFNDDVDGNVGVNNVAITSTLENVLNPEITSLSVENDIVYIEYRPLFSGIQYKLVFFSTDSVKFRSAGGEVITEDGSRNSKFIVSPGDTSDVVKKRMLEELPTIYETDEDTLVKKLISGVAGQLHLETNVTR